MKKVKADKGRLGIGVKPENLRGKRQEEVEQEDLSSMTIVPSSVLMELWNNEKDSVYDKR